MSTPAKTIAVNLTLEQLQVIEESLSSVHFDVTNGDWPHADEYAARVTSAMLPVQEAMEALGHTF